MPTIGQALPVSIEDLALALVIAFILGWCLRIHFLTFGKALINRKDIGDILPFIVLIVTLIISIVKSSLALSLGLVGALSIVRFRTPIKEPEELAYLFMAIAIGLGLGANQILATTLATIFILVAVVLFSFIRKRQDNQNLYLSVQWDKDHSDAIKEISDFISSSLRSCDLRRMDSHDDGFHLIYYVNAGTADNVLDMVADLKQKYDGISVSLIDQNRIPNV